MAQEPFKVLKWAELAALAGLRSAQLQLAIVPRLCFKSKNGFSKLCSGTNCASFDNTYSLICKNRLTLLPAPSLVNATKSDGKTVNYVY